MAFYKKIPLALLVVFLVSVIGFSVKSEASLSDAEKALQVAEGFAGALKWEVSIEYRKNRYPLNPISYPDMELYNDTKEAYYRAARLIAEVPNTNQKRDLQTRLENNVTVYYKRAQAYIDAITSGKKIFGRTNEMVVEYAGNPVSDNTELSYHALSSEIRKQAILLYRVYGKSTRAAILQKYKEPGQQALDLARNTVSIKMTADDYNESVTAGVQSTALETRYSEIEKAINILDSDIISVKRTGEWITLTADKELVSKDERQMIQYVNEERGNKGLAPLIINRQLTHLARVKAGDLIKNSYFDHVSPVFGSPFTMMTDYGIDYRYAGENLAGSYSVLSAHQALMNSPGHRANILNPSYKEIAVGIIDGGPYGKMFVQLFITK